jgi:hypothetical protein
MGYFYIEAKSFELLSEGGNISIRFAKRSIGIYRAVILGKPSVMWLQLIVKELIRGEKLREFCGTFRYGSIV